MWMALIIVWSGWNSNFNEYSHLKQFLNWVRLKIERWDREIRPYTYNNRVSRYLCAFVVDVVDVFCCMWVYARHSIHRNKINQQQSTQCDTERERERSTVRDWSVRFHDDIACMRDYGIIILVKTCIGMGIGVRCSTYGSIENGVQK